MRLSHAPVRKWILGIFVLLHWSRSIFFLSPFRILLTLKSDFAHCFSYAVQFWIWVRGQLPAGEEMPGSSSGQRCRQEGGLACGAHAHLRLGRLAEHMLISG
jgi:hypothetical protein